MLRAYKMLLALFPIIWYNDKQEQLLLGCLSISLSKNNFVRMINNVDLCCKLWIFFLTVGKWWKKHETGLIPWPCDHLNPKLSSLLLVS